ncbi:M1 family metallopeptidase [Flavisolibacter ginsenosidimutans]|uniref:M1 family metallopeptidase n=1 Tax=Flavisolibacter ginsenosidimutans TaxID=661481 RepID=A0A5B8UFQ2_9BACT|nr:M1 family metallopeptidase [Flavisolibacter ginsenosidimutans]QEC55205.1 M1 family metallopeptidase [Flavisolibacter ginsenosidimutans]
MKKRLCILFTLFVFALCSFSQLQLPLPRNILAIYQNGTRTTDGKPGKAYWQNRANYLLHVDFDPETRLVSGTVDINYTNNSPDTLRQIWFKLYPNLYKRGTPRESKISERDLTEGLMIDSMWINNQTADKARIAVDGTNMTVNRQSVPHGANIRFRIAYHYTLNKTSHVRTGEVEPGAAFVAYFFPRIAVYDDIDGWNRHPYDGRLEFYNDFCNFDSYITVPKNFTVWATGDLQNCNEVLAPTICQRIAQAEKSNAIINVIDTTDDKQNITAKNPFNTWHFKAENVTDFVFATSDHYIWQSSSLVVDPNTGRRTRVDAAFNPKHKDYFMVADDAHKTIKAMSYVFPAWAYPYNHETVFDGLDQMEYPMMVNDNPTEGREESITLTDHEIFHTMFPFYMGINETKYAWMDEGWATIGEWIISPLIDSSIVDTYGVLPTERHLGTEADLPIIALSTETNAAYYTNSYPEPAMGYLYAKDLLGDSLFTKALHHYIEQWHGKHPVPFDFFNCMNTGSGKNLNWFWKRWFFDGGYADLAVASVKKTNTGYSILVSAKGTKPVPLDLTLTYADGTKGKVHRSIAVWEKGASSVVINVSTGRRLQSVQLGSTWVPDANKKDNVYIVK